MNNYNMPYSLLDPDNLDYLRREIRRLYYIANSKPSDESSKNKEIHFDDLYNKDNIEWNYKNGCGGFENFSNTSNGYHGILIQWLEYYNTGTNVLLVSEADIVKKEFEKKYPKLNFYTIDFFPGIQYGDADYKLDICNMNDSDFTIKFDLIINQATLEHVYDPYGAMKNLVSILNKNGIIVTHTHPPGYRYHQFPRDYIRFMKDWWYDLPKNLNNNIELLQLWMFQNSHIFTCYKKIL